ncbi:MAG TPA: Hsp70 family protein [Acidimicrobiales bacterium]
MAYYLGIDLGTTYTAAAAERDGVVESLTLGNRIASVPSVVFLRDDGEILVGEAATRRAITDPGRVAREFKRRVGDPTPIILGGTPYAAEMLMARLLRWSVDQVREQQGEPPRAIALTHPANWGPYKLDLFAQAVRQVDLDAALTLPEPVAAATFYASQRRLEPGSVVAVYDLGGGTFDAAMVRRTDHGFETIGSPEGMERLGGIDFDEAVFAHVRNAIGDGLERLDPDEPAARAAVARLRQECIDAKEALSSDTDTSIPVLLPGLQTEVRLTRSEFEAMIRPAISETIVALRRAIRSANVEAADISAVLLVGGSSRIPLVAQMVGAELGRPIAIDAHPKDAIAFGAAIAVAEQRGAASPETVTTVLADVRPPPPTVSSDAGRRPAPPGAAAATAGVPAGAVRPPAPGARPAPPGRPAGQAVQARVGARPAPPGAGASRPAPPGTAAGPGAVAGQPAPPAARGPVDRSTLAPPSAPGRPSPPPGRPSSPGAPTSGERPAPPPGRAGAPGRQTAGVGRGPATTPFGGTPRAGGTPIGGHSSGGYPAAPAARSGGDNNNRALWIVLAVVAVIAVAVIVIATTRGGGGDGAETGGGGGTGGSGTDEAASGYTDAVEQEFMDECVPGPGQAFCECSYDLIVETIPFERFQEMDAALAEDPTIEFEELTAIQSECAGAA